jgi:hypothetical protein
MKFNCTRWSLLIGASVLLAGTFGCLETADSVMEGTWELIPSQNTDPPLTDWFLTFDARGDLTKVVYTVGGALTVTWNDPKASVDLTGEELHISATYHGSGLTFDGTLNSSTAPTTATGDLSTNLALGGVTISVLQGQATLVKQ